MEPVRPELSARVRRRPATVGVGAVTRDWGRGGEKGG
jgi:hypothetical protein